MNGPHLWAKFKKPSTWEYTHEVTYLDASDDPQPAYGPHKFAFEYRGGVDHSTLIEYPYGFRCINCGLIIYDKPEDGPIQAREPCPVSHRPYSK